MLPYFSFRRKVANQPTTVDTRKAKITWILNISLMMMNDLLALMNPDQVATQAMHTIIVMNASFVKKVVE